MKFVSRLTLFPAAFILPALLSVFVIWNGCNEETPAEPEPNRGVALRDIAFLYKQQFDLQINNIRVGLLFTANDMSGIDLESEEAASSLQSLYESIEDYLLFAGLMDDSGRVIVAYPARYDSALSGENLCSLSWVSDTIDSLLPNIGQVELDDEGARCFDYIFPVTEAESLQGMLWGSVSLDTLTRRTFAYSAFNSSEEERIFIMDEEGHIIHDEDESLFGANFTDSTTFSIENTELAIEMLNDVSGNNTYISDHSPGAEVDGEKRLIGWTWMFLENTHWVLAVTEPVQ